jgi:hypothetical protein
MKWKLFTKNIRKILPRIPMPAHRSHIFHIRRGTETRTTMMDLPLRRWCPLPSIFLYLRRAAAAGQASKKCRLTFGVRRNMFKSWHHPMNISIQQSAALETENHPFRLSSTLHQRAHSFMHAYKYILCTWMERDGEKKKRPLLFSRNASRPSWSISQN